MKRIARVSAVFLLVLGMWCGGVWSGEARSQEISAQRPDARSDAGVGTRLAALGDEVSQQAQKQTVAKARPLDIFREVEQGWRSGTPKPFERYLGKGKVRLDFGEGGPRGGLFTRSQAYYLIADYLRRTHTVNIKLLRVAEQSKRGPRPYALLERKCRYKNGVSGKEKIFVLLSAESGQWVISELRIIPAK
jgi:hypothetical protein